MTLNNLFQNRVSTLHTGTFQSYSNELRLPLIAVFKLVKGFQQYIFVVCVLSNHNILDRLRKENQMMWDRAEQPLRRLEASRKQLRYGYMIFEEGLGHIGGSDKRVSKADV